MIQDSTFFTILGGAGFIGSELALYLKNRGLAYVTPEKGDSDALQKPLGHVLYCAGTTSDFRQRPFDTVHAHVSLLNGLLRDGDYVSLTYLSSTRVYIHSESTIETAAIKVFPTNDDDIFNLSKLLGESICNRSGRANVRAIRISNVVGNNFQSNDFVFSLIREAVELKKLYLHTTPDSAKDYLHIDDATRMIVEIAQRGTQSIYNLASGTNLTNQAVVQQISAATGATVTYSDAAQKICFPPIDISRISEEFDFKPKSLLGLIHDLAAARLAYRRT